MKKLFAIVLALVFVLSAFAFAEGEKTTVTIWHTFTKDQEAYLVKAAEDFNALQDKYFVEVLPQAYSGFTDTVKNAVRSGDGPFARASVTTRFMSSSVLFHWSKPTKATVTPFFSA